MQEIKFEEAVKRLEEITETLESGVVSLEESLKLFEEGAKIAEYCHSILDGAEKRMQILSKDKGNFNLQENNLD